MAGIGRYVMSDIEEDYGVFIAYGLGDDDVDDEGDLDYQEEEEDDEDEEEEAEEEYLMDVDDADYVPPDSISRVASSFPRSPAREEVVVCRGEVEEATGPLFPGGGEIRGSCAGGECSSQSETDGLFCPICMQAWTSEGDHHICCLPCGHIFGMSCIKKWLQYHRRSAKCPQCNSKCTLKDVRKLYASRVVSVDENLQKEIQSLETKCASLEAKCSSLERKSLDWCKKEIEWLNKEDILHHQVEKLTARISYLECLQGDTLSKQLGSADTYVGFGGQQAVPNHDLGSNVFKQRLSCNFVVQEEFQVDGGRLFDVDASRKILIIARRLSGFGGMHSLCKMSLMRPYDTEIISLPNSTKAVKDIHLSPCGRLALISSLGKKLSLLSMDTNNIVLTYELPAAAWSCAWDQDISNFLYAGLQNGKLLVFDMRQTSAPLESLSGVTCHPVHSVHSGAGSILTASSVGLSDWCFHGPQKGARLVPDTENQGVCISLAATPSRNEIVASFRPAVTTAANSTLTQPPLTPVSGITHCSHLLYERVAPKLYQKVSSASTHMDSVRLPRSLLMPTPDSNNNNNNDNNNCLFAYGDEASCELVLKEVPSFRIVQRLKRHAFPIRDVRYSQNVLGCLSDDMLQLFCSNSC